MLTVNLSIADTKAGFLSVQCIHRVRFPKVGDFDTALNACIDEFDEWADKRPESNLFRVHKSVILETMASLSSPEDLETVMVDYTNPLHKTKHLIAVIAQDRI